MAVACLRMAISQFFKIVPSEEVLEKELNTNDKIGTHPDKIQEVAEKYGLKVLKGENGDLNDLDKLIEQNYVIALLISVDVPHFVIYLENNGNHIFFNDPFFGEGTAVILKKFLSPNSKGYTCRWKIHPEDFKAYDDIVESYPKSTRGWFAFTKA